MVAVALRTSGEAREIRARTGLGEPLTPHVVAGEDAGRAHADEDVSADEGLPQRAGAVPGVGVVRQPPLNLKKFAKF